MSKKKEMEAKDDKDDQPQAGIFVTRGLTLTIPKGKLVLRITPDGGLDSSVTMHVLQDVCPYWLEIAYQHLVMAEKSNKDVHAAIQNDAKSQLATELETEFKSGMQAIMAAAIAIDAFYATLKDHIVLPKELTEIWHKNKTARHKQIAEVMKRAFKMNNENQKKIRHVLKEIFRFRDLAVHPSSQANEPILHPELKIGTEWRFVAFSYQNAKALVGVVLSLISQVIEKPKNDFPKLVTYCQSVKALITPVLTQWETQYGELLKKKTD